MLLVAINVALVIWIMTDKDETPADATNPFSAQTMETIPTETAPPDKLTDSINLPGYAALYLKAGVTEQDLALPNLPENFCQIRISLLLDDTTVIWTSELVQPGEAATIVLSEPLEAGCYSATLLYECFRIDENMSSLNGARFPLLLYVD